MDALFHCPANFAPLSPVRFLKRAAAVYGRRKSLVYGDRVFTWSETYRRCLKLASALVHHFHISPGDLVAAMAPNTPELYELHYAVPMAGAIICPLNPKLDAPTLALLLQQLHPKIIFVHSQSLQILLNSLSQFKLPPLVLLHPPNSSSGELATHALSGPPFLSPPDPQHYPCLNFDRVLAMGFPNFTPKPNAELDPISVNCTSGSTGLHKPVVYTHRATYLNSLATILRTRIRTPPPPVFLWTVDMFRCNGWCFIWAMAALGGCNVCLTTTTNNVVTADAILAAVELHQVTLLCGPPPILKTISAAPCRNPLPRRVDLIVAGALPVPEILTKVAEFGFNVSHGYGMTEALGPAVIRPCGNENEIDEINDGLVDLITWLEIDVKDSVSMESVVDDGETLGEIMLRGNTLMSGYYKNPIASGEAFKGGEWYRSGDVGVRKKGGGIEMKDRGKDIIIVRSEKGAAAAVSTVEVEAVLLSHPKVAEAAVVGLGESPCGFVKLNNGCTASVEEIVGFCGAHLPDYMVPERVIFGDLPLNSTGKVQKFVVRENANALFNQHPQ